MGRFNDMSGDLVVDTPEKSKIRVDVKVDSVDTRSEGLDKHLKSPDFFNAVQFPTLSFVSSAVTLNGGGEGTVAGNLTLHGVTKPVTFKLKEIGAGNGPRGDSRVGYTASTTIKRSDFGIAYGIPKAATGARRRRPRPSPASSPSPMRSTCRSSRRTMSISRRPTSLRRMTRSSASPTAPMSISPARGGG